MAKRTEEPSLLDAIREAPERGAYETTAYHVGPRTPGYDRITGTARRKVSTLAEAIAWGREHGGIYNVYRWDGAQWLWCCNSDTADGGWEG